MSARARAVLLAIPLITQLLLTPAARAADRPVVWFPVGPGSEGSVFTRATTTDPFELTTNGPTAMEFTLFTVEPGGTTGSLPRPGLTVTAVADGVATVLSAQGQGCVPRSVNAGSALIETDGGAMEIRNDSHTPLAVYTAAFSPAGGAPAPLSAGPCAATTAKQAAIDVLTRAIVERSFSVESKGMSDVYLGAARFAPGGVIDWHVQHRPLFGGVGEGTITVDFAEAGGCRTDVFPTGAGFLEPAQTVHAVRNESSDRATFYYVVFAATPQPFLAPSPTPRQCGRS